MGTRVGYQLNEICKDQVNRGRSMLSALVVGANGRSGAAFFECARTAPGARRHICLHKRSAALRTRGARYRPFGSLHKNDLSSPTTRTRARVGDHGRDARRNDHRQPVCWQVESVSTSPVTWGVAA